MSIIRYTVEVILIVLGLVLITIGVLTVTHGTPVRNVIAPGPANLPPAPADTLFREIMELYTGTQLARGNEIQMLNNGMVYEQLWADIRNAKRTITVQFYYSQPGAVADSLRDNLIARARAGVRVMVLLDAFGSGPLRKMDFVPALKAAGVSVAWLRPLRWYSLNRAATRSHVRAIVLDGRIGYTGGFGLADYWLGDGLHEGQWRDSNVRFEGPAVAQLQAAFVAGWAEATGNLLTGDDIFPKSAFDPVGTKTAALMHTIPTLGSTPAERFLALTIAGARKRLYISNSYFVPDDYFRTALKEAAQRGVDVRVLTAGDRSDVKSTLYAGRDYYSDLLRGGVRIFEYQPTMMHSKTIVADALWSSIGSMNFDNRSMAFNNEANLNVFDAKFGAEMDSVFLNDLTHSKEIKLQEWEKRGWTERVLEWGAEKLWRVL